MKTVIAALLLTAVTVRGYAAGCSTLKYSTPFHLASVKISTGSGWSAYSGGTASSLINGAINYWDGPCDDPGIKYPSMCNGCTVSGAYPVTVSYSTADIGRCGSAVSDGASGSLPTWTAVTIYATAQGISCAPYADVLAHELGHVLGLADPVDPTSCNGSIMGARAPGGTRTVTSADCAAADDATTTPTETRIQQCQDTCGTTCDEGGYCSNGGMVGYVGTPIIVDVAGDGIRLSGADDLVSFDLNGDGIVERITWTARESTDAFLALDLNGNGAIDDGRELFGDATLLPNQTRAANGYAALAQYDADGDGSITSADGIYEALRLWMDANHDGVAEAAEVTSLRAAGVWSLDVTYVTSNHLDPFRNLLRYKSQARVAGPGQSARTVNTFDVLFQF